MSTSSKIPATDRSAGGPGSSHVDRTKAPQDVTGAHHQNHPEQHKHPHPEEQNSAGGGGTKHEKRHPGEGGRA